LKFACSYCCGIVHYIKGADKHLLSRRSSHDLFHEPCLTIAISILLGIKFVHETRLLVFGGGRVVVVTIRVVATSTSQAAVVGGVVKITVLVVRGTGGRVIGVADVSETTSGAASDILRNTLKLVETLLTTAEHTSLGLELVHGHGRQSSGLVVGGCVVVNLVDGDSGVDNIWLDNLLVDDGLNSLVDVVVNMLSTDGGCYTLALGGTLNATLVPELRLLLNKVPLGRVVVAVVKLAVLYGTKLGGVCLRKNLTILDGLNSAVVVVLVNLLIDGSVDLFVLVRLNSLVDYSRCNSLVDCGVMVAGLVGEVGESCLDFVHVDVCR